jgi:hypothetical protein
MAGTSPAKATSGCMGSRCCCYRIFGTGQPWVCPGHPRFIARRGPVDARTTSGHDDLWWTMLQGKPRSLYPGG